MTESDLVSNRWLLLLPQLPAKPSYVRVKLWRRLQALGAIGLKNAAYVLPATEETREDFEWLRREIEQGGGEATVCEARFIDGRSDEDVVAAFNAARERDYLALGETIRSDAADLGGYERRRDAWLARYARIVAIDFFGAPGREIVDALLFSEDARGERRMETGGKAATAGRTWVTRADVKVDRIASAWLISRFIDREARFGFVREGSAASSTAEVRFDMFDGEYTHRGDRCTFEVLLEDFKLQDRALKPIAEIIHDLDLKDDKYRRPETAGVSAMLGGIVAGTSDDLERVRRGGELFDGLYLAFGGKPQ